MFHRIRSSLQLIAFAYIASQFGMVTGAGNPNDPNKVWATVFALVGLAGGIAAYLLFTKYVIPFIQRKLAAQPPDVRLAADFIAPIVLLILLVIGVVLGDFWASIHRLRGEIGIGLGFVLFLLVADTFSPDFTRRVILGMCFVVAFMITNEILLALHPRLITRLLREPRVFGPTAFVIMALVVLFRYLKNNWPVVKGWLQNLWQLWLAVPQPGAKGAKPQQR
jgi:hypothetical protein